MSGYPGSSPPPADLPLQTQSSQSHSEAPNPPSSSAPHPAKGSYHPSSHLASELAPSSLAGHHEPSPTLQPHGATDEYMQSLDDQYNREMLMSSQGFLPPSRATHSDFHAASSRPTGPGSLPTSQISSQSGTQPGTQGPSASSNAAQFLTPRRVRGDIAASPHHSQRLYSRLYRPSGSYQSQSQSQAQVDEVPSSLPPSVPSSLMIIPESESAAADLNDPSASTTVIWGTDINVDRALESFHQFLRRYTRQHLLLHRQLPLSGALEETEPFYPRLMRQLCAKRSYFLNLDAEKLRAFPSTTELYHQLLRYPQEIIPVMDHALAEWFKELHPAFEDALPVWKVRPYNLHRSVNMRSLDPVDIDQLVTIKGLMIRATSVIPDLKRAFFRCSLCNQEMWAPVDRGHMLEPSGCRNANCRAIHSMTLIHNRCEFSDKQLSRLQEVPDAIPDGQTPHTISLCVYDELVDVGRPGDRLEITGIYRCVPIRMNSRQRAVRTLFRTYIDVIHIRRGDEHSMEVGRSPRGQREGGEATGPATYVEDDHLDVADGADSEDEDMGTDQDTSDHAVAIAQGLDADEVRAIRGIAADPNVLSILANSLAPSIFEHEDVKRGLLLQLFGGVSKGGDASLLRPSGGELVLDAHLLPNSDLAHPSSSMPDPSSTQDDPASIILGVKGTPRIRGDIHVLLVGDPSTSKSQLLQYAHRLAPRGVFTSGKGSSAVGLTAYVTRDPETKQLVLESGALVLSDSGVCCIDEFDKMSEGARAVLHEVMEQQTVSVAKAGIVTTLNARTSVLACANPIGSRWNAKLSVPQNIDLPPTLLSRFDLLYLLLDRVNEDFDRRLAEHLVSLYLEDGPGTAANMSAAAAAATRIDRALLGKYIAYARAQCEPRLTEGAAASLEDAYVALRRVGGGKRITATPRQLESLIRLSEAHARLHLSEAVRVEDVTEAVRLLRAAMQESAIQPGTGLIDMDLLNTGMSADMRERLAALKEDLKRMVRERGSIPYNLLLREVNESGRPGLGPKEVSQALTEMNREGSVRTTGTRNQQVVHWHGAEAES